MSAESWFKFFPSDWLGGTAGLSAAERGVYVTLIAAIYDQGGPIKRDDARLARQCGLPKAGFVRALQALVDLGKIEIEGCDLTNSRAKRELIERENRIAVARAGAAVTNGKAQKKSTNVFRSSDALASESATDPAMRSKRYRALTQEPEPDSMAEAIERVAGSREAEGSRMDPIPNASLPGRSTSISVDEPLSEPDLAAAIAAGVSESQAAAEWRAFVDFNLANANRSFNWSAKWRLWLHRSKTSTHRQATERLVCMNPQKNSIPSLSPERPPAMLPSPSR